MEAKGSPERAYQDKPSATSLSALILEDNDSDYEILLHNLKRSGFEVSHKRVFDEAGYSAALERGLDIILADYHLPQFDALSALRILRERGYHVPFIVVTGSLSEEAAVACLKSGATDYLIKDRLARLGPAITQALEARKAVEAKYAAERQIRRRNRELTMLNRIIAASAEGRDERSVLSIACQELATVLGAERTAAVVLSPDRKSAQSVVHYSRKKDGDYLDEIIGLEGSEMRRVEAELVAPIVINDLAGSGIHAKMRDALLPKGIRSVAILPIMLGGASEGCLALAASKKDFFEEEELALSRSVADQLANSLARARLEQRYLQAQKMEAVGRLAGGIAHDFNNLLTVIMGYADVLAIDLAADAEHLPEALEIKKAAESAAGLTRQLLAFSRRQILQPSVVDLNAIVEGMKGMLKPIIGPNIAIETELDPALGAIRADPGQMEQIIMNLSVNARDAMPEGGRLVLSTRNVDADPAFVLSRPELRPGPYVALGVADSGTGLSDEAMAHLFEPFYTTKAEGKGTGLGLSTVYGIVKQSGGFVSAASEPGKGARFEMLFPRLAQDGADKSERAGAGAEAPVSGRIVIAEDEAPVRELTRRILSRIGYRVVATESAKEALGLVADGSEAADLLVTDILMPEMSGLELARLARESVPGLKILLVSGFADDESVAAAAAQPNTAFLAKPFTYEELSSVLRELLKSGDNA